MSGYVGFALFVLFLGMSLRAYGDIRADDTRYDGNPHEDPARVEKIVCLALWAALLVALGFTYKEEDDWWDIASNLFLIIGFPIMYLIGYDRRRYRWRTNARIKQLEEELAKRR